MAFDVWCHNVILSTVLGLQCGSHHSDNGNNGTATTQPCICIDHHSDSRQVMYLPPHVGAGVSYGSVNCRTGRPSRSQSQFGHSSVAA